MSLFAGFIFVLVFFGGWLFPSLVDKFWGGVISALVILIFLSSLNGVDVDTVKTLVGIGFVGFLARWVWECLLTWRRNEAIKDEVGPPALRVVKDTPDERREDRRI